MQPLQRMSIRGPWCIASTNIDTDQIIPARFLTTTTKDGLGKQLFADWRYQADGAPEPDFVLNRPEARRLRRFWWPGAISAAAPRASTRPGHCSTTAFRAVISTEIADIFRSNALKNGLLPDRRRRGRRARWLLEHPGAEVDIDLERDARLTLPDGARVDLSHRALRTPLPAARDGRTRLSCAASSTTSSASRRRAADEGHDRGAAPATASARRSRPKRCARSRRWRRDSATRCEFRERRCSAAPRSTPPARPCRAATLALCRARRRGVARRGGRPEVVRPDAKVRPEAGPAAACARHSGCSPICARWCRIPRVLDASPIKAELLQGVDIMVVRELTGGIYFGDKIAHGRRKPSTCAATRVVGDRARGAARRAACARARRGKLTSVDKANVLETSRLWRDGRRIASCRPSSPT